MDAEHQPHNRWSQVRSLPAPTPPVTTPAESAACAGDGSPVPISAHASQQAQQHQADSYQGKKHDQAPDDLCQQHLHP
jgi:hypothetical protein